jgi:two-component system sensor histidine kinase YesM
VRKTIKRGVREFRGSVWYQVGFWFCILFIGMVVLFQVFLKNEYYSYLLAQNISLRSVLLNTLQYDISDELNSEKSVASGIVIQEEMYYAAKDIAKEEAGMSRKLEFQRLLQRYSRYSGSILNLAIVGEDREIYQYDKYEKQSKQMWNDSNKAVLYGAYDELMKNLNKGGEPRYVVTTEENIHPFREDEVVFHILYPIIGTKKNFSYASETLCVTYSMKLFDPFLKVINRDDKQHVSAYVIDENSRVIYHEDKGVIGKTEKEYLSTSEFITDRAPIRGSSWQLAVAIDKEQMKASVGEIFHRGMGVYIAMILLFSIVLFLLLRKLLSPLKIVKSEMDNISRGKEQQSIKVKGNTEIWELAKHFNVMLVSLENKEKEVKYYHQEEIRALERQREAEIEALESHINAHFISNTLGAISYEAIEAGNDHLALMIKKLSNILRYTFNQSAQTVDLYKEIEWTEQYLYLQKERLQDVFDYNIEFDQLFKQEKCCKLMMQPFVENAIVHGFHGYEEGGCIIIKVTATTEGWMMWIQDNGRGMTKEQEASIQAVLKGDYNVKVPSTGGTGVGVLNAVSRIKKFYSEAITMELATKPDQGTIFRFYIRRKHENLNSRG